MEGERDDPQVEAPVGDGIGPPARHAELAGKLQQWRDAGDSAGQMRSLAQVAHRQRWCEVADLNLESVTPIFGGGVVAGKNDLLLPIRPRAIKNLMRHWWWLLNRWSPCYQGDGGSKRLYEDMVALWGGPAQEGEDRGAKVRVLITLSTRDLEQYRFTYLPYRAGNKIDAQTGNRLTTQDPNEPWLYALFPAKGENKRVDWETFCNAAPQLSANPVNGRRLLSPVCAENLFKKDGLPSDLLAPGIKFRMQVEVSDVSLKPAVRDAMLAWLCFGGVGARTTRGLGHILMPIGTASAEDIARVEAALGISDSLSWIGPTSIPAVGAWEVALRKYRDFRQLRDPRSDRGYHPGRSYWPKADVVRALTDRDMNGGHCVEHAAVTKGEDRGHPDALWPLPEMYFGAPMIVKFIDEKDCEDGEGDPYAVELVPARSAQLVLDRFMSPVLTIPWWNDASRKWQPRIVALPYERDLADVGVVVRKSGKGDSNTFKYLSNGGGEAAFIEPGAWWPSKADCGQQWSALVSQIWAGTPGGNDNAAMALRATGGKDPIEALFAYLGRGQT